MYESKTCRKIPIISPGLIFVQMAFLLGLFSGQLIWEGLITGGNFAFQNCLDLTVKTAQDYENILKQLKTANPNGPWAYIWEGLLWKKYLRLRFGGLIFGRAYFIIFFNRNFTVY